MRKLNYVMNSTLIAAPSAYVQRFEVALNNFQEWKRELKKQKLQQVLRPR